MADLSRRRFLTRVTGVLASGTGACLLSRRLLALPYAAGALPELKRVRLPFGRQPADTPTIRFDSIDGGIHIDAGGWVDFQLLATSASWGWHEGERVELPPNCIVINGALIPGLVGRALSTVQPGQLGWVRLSGPLVIRHPSRQG